MLKIRRGTFETNSSSTHSICICTEEEYDKWKNGELVYDCWLEQIHPVTEEDAVTLVSVRNGLEEAQENDDEMDWEDREFLEKNLTYEEAQEDNEYYNWYHHSFTTPSGDKMVVFGWYGHD